MKDKVFLWAEQYLKLPAGSVTGVYIGIDDDGWASCSCYSSSSGVWVTHSVPLTGRQRKPRYKDAFIDLGGESLSSLICAILELEE